MSITTWLRTLLPMLAFTLLSIVPLSITFALARNAKQHRDSRLLYRRSVAIVLGSLLVLFTVSGFLWGKEGKGSTGGLIFLFLPIYTAIVVFLGAKLVAVIQWSRAKFRHLPIPLETSVPNSGPFPSILLWVFYRAAGVLFVLCIGLLLFVAVHNIRMSVAESPATSAPELRALYETAMGGKEADDGVLLFLAQNPSTPPDTLEKLCSSPYDHVRVHAAKHRSTPSPALVSLLQDFNDFVRDSAKANLAARK